MKKKAITISVVALIMFSLGILTVQSFRKVRHRSQDSTVRCTLRQLAAAAQQYFLEHNDKEWCSFDDLVGPRGYLNTVSITQGEDYREDFPLRKGFTKISVTTKRGQVITYSTTD